MIPLSTLSISNEILSQFENIVGKKYVLLDNDANAYGQDKCSYFQGRASVVLLPQTTEQVQQIVITANQHHIALVPSGGRTGLSGGATASQGEVVVAMDKINYLKDFNATENSVVCGAGVITQNLQAFAEQQGLLYPVDFASAGSSQIGGNISTNAGGINVIRYGMTRDWVLGLTVVTGKGDILELNHGLQKNNTGYDLRHLFIGSEGTLGFITEACIKLTKPATDLRVLLFAVPELEHIMQIFNVFKQQLSLRAFEFFSDNALNKLIQHTDLQAPFAEPQAYYVLLELDIDNPTIEQTAYDLSEYCLEKTWATDCIISQTIQQAKQLWRLREDISSTLARFQPYKNDLSVTVSKVPSFLQAIAQTVNADYPDFEVVWYGHIGDGNLHLNILKPEALDAESFRQRCHHVSEKIMAIVQQFQGSISAEHGVGLLKKDFLCYSRTPAEIAYMKQIKSIFDPNNIINPGKIFD